MSVSMTRCGVPGASRHELVPGRRRSCRVEQSRRLAVERRPAGATPGWPPVRRPAPSSRCAVVTSTRTAQSRRMWPTWGGLSSGFTGTNTPPAIVAPKIVATVSGRLGR